MTTLLTALFYLWLVTSILLCALWFLRRQDRSRRDEPDPDVLLPGFDGPDLEGGIVEVSPAANIVDPVDTDNPINAVNPINPLTAQRLANEQANGHTNGTPETAEQPEPGRDSEVLDEADTVDGGIDVEPAIEQVNGSSSNGDSPNGSTANSGAAEQPQADSGATTTTTQTKNQTGTQTEKRTETVTANSGEVSIDDLESERPSATKNAQNGSKGKKPAGKAEPSSEVVRPPTILELLDGISLPYDLTSLTARIEDPDRHAVFLSTHGDAGDVGTAFADQLVELGYEIEAAGFDQATAKRNGDVVSMRISADAGSCDEGEEPRYPTANASDVAIEVWTGTGPPPQLAD